MYTHRARAYCAHCGDHVLATRAPFPHGRYVTGSLFTLGLVLPVYLVQYLMHRSHFRCGACGLVVRRADPAPGTVAGLSAATLIAVALWASAIARAVLRQ